MNQRTLNYYLNRYLDSTITAEEWKVLQELLQNNNQLGELEALMDEQLHQAGEAPQAVHINESIKAKVLDIIKKDKIKLSAQEQTPIIEYAPPTVPAKFNWWKYAAAAILITMITYSWLQSRKDSTPIVKHEIAVIQPGRDGAILTLADGSQLTLDSLENGEIASQQGSKVVLQNGQLLYNDGGIALAQQEFNTITTPRGRQFQLTLPDGTKIWMNAASSITFPTNFNRNHRHVSISGEVYFEIAPSSTQPFSIEANNVTIEVLGTSFNVNAYEDAAAIKTTVLEGSVKVKNNFKSRDADKAIVLHANQQAEMNDKKSLFLTDINISQALAWKNGLFNFQDLPFAEVMQQLSRWYNIEVVYENGIPNIEFGGKLGRDVSFEKMLVFFKESGIQFKIDHQTLIIFNKQI